MALLNAEQILAADDKKTKLVHVPEWGGEVMIRTLSGAERDRFEASTVKQKGNSVVQNLDNLRARLVALCLVNDEGGRLFSDSEALKLGRKNAAVLDRLFTECRELNGMSEEDVEELTESFDDAPSESSTSE